MRYSLILLLVLTGCTIPRWHKDGGNEAQFRRDAAECEAKNPMRTQTTSQTNCSSIGSSISCNTQQQNYGGPADALNQWQAIDSCLYAKGYYKK